MSVDRKSRPGTCLPSTTRHTVSGVASSKPIEPHNQVHAATATNSATCDTPAAPAYRIVSSTRLVNSSTATNSPTTDSGLVHPGSAARLARIGPAAAPTGPRYGTKRSAAPSAAQSSGYGVPSAHKPAPIATP